MSEFVEKAMDLGEACAVAAARESYMVGGYATARSSLLAHLEAREAVVEKLVEALEMARRVLEIEGCMNAANTAADALALARGEKA